MRPVTPGSSSATSSLAAAAERPRWHLDAPAPGVLRLRLDDPASSLAPDLESWFSCLDELLRRANGSSVVVLDLSGAKPDAGRRRRVFDWAIANRRLYAERVRAAAIVAPSPLLRGVLTAARWFLPMTLRHAVFDRGEDALAWAREEWLRG